MDIFLQPRVELTPKAQEYLRRTGVKELYLEQVNIQQCCVPLISPPEVHKGIPSKAENFVTMTFEEFTIYYERDLKTPPVMIIDIQNFGFLKNLVVKNWRISI